MPIVVIKIFIAVRCGEGDLFSVRRPNGIPVRALQIHDFLEGFVRQRQDIDVLRIVRSQIRITLRGKRNAGGIGRPLQAAHGVIAALGEPLWRRESVVIRIHRQQPQVRKGVLLLYHIEFAVLFLAFLSGFIFWVAGDESDVLAIARPFKLLHARFGFGEQPRFPALWPDQINLVAPVALARFRRRPVAQEGEPLAIRRPRRCGTGFFRVGELIGVGGTRVGNPNFCFVGVFFPIGLAHHIRDFSVHRHARRGNRFHTQ